MRLWTVRIAAHEVMHELYRGGGPYPIPFGEHAAAAPDERSARKAGIEAAHRAAKVPPFRSLLRQSWPHAVAIVDRDLEAERDARMKRRR